MLRRLILVGVVLAVAIALVGLPIAGAQTAVGGDVPSFLQVSVTQPNGFGSFPKRAGTHTYSLSIPAQITATEAPLTMSISDGTDPSGARHGHLVSGSTVLTAPIQVATSASSWASLDASTAPPLAQWTQAITRAPATIRLRQQVPASVPRSGYHKLLLLTVSAQTP